MYLCNHLTKGLLSPLLAYSLLQCTLIAFVLHVSYSPFLYYLFGFCFVTFSALVVRWYSKISILQVVSQIVSGENIISATPISEIRYRDILHLPNKNNN